MHDLKRRILIILTVVFLISLMTFSVNILALLLNLLKNTGILILKVRLLISNSFLFGITFGRKMVIWKGQ